MKLKLHLLVSSFILALSLQAKDLEGVSGNVLVVSPNGNETVSKQGKYTANAGDLVILKYSYAVTPSSIPKKVSWESSDKKIVDISLAGVRSMMTTPMIAGSGTISYFFEARKEGTANIQLIIDKEEYNYTIKVVR